MKQNKAKAAAPGVSNSADAAISGLLQEGETIIKTADISTGIYWKGAAVFVVGVLLLVKAFNLGLFIIFVSLLMLSVSYLTQYYLRLVLTDKRVIIRCGIVNLDVIQMHHNKIESVELSRTIIGRFLGYATILISGTGSRVTAVPFVNNPDSFRSALDKIIFDREESKNK